MKFKESAFHLVLGAARALDLGAVTEFRTSRTHKIKRSQRNGFEEDAVSLRSDWECVGRDIQFGINKVCEETSALAK